MTSGMAPCIMYSFIPFLRTTNPEGRADVALRRGSSYHAGDQWMLHFEEKCGKSREVPVRHDLEQMLFEYIEAAGLRNAPKDVPIFQTAERKTGRLTKNNMYVVDACRMVKRRLKDASLPMRLSPHSLKKRVFSRICG